MLLNEKQVQQLHSAMLGTFNAVIGFLAELQSSDPQQVSGMHRNSKEDEQSIWGGWKLQRIAQATEIESRVTSA